MNVMEDATYLDLIAKSLSGNISPTEKQELMAWVDASETNKAFFEESIQLWSISDNYVEQYDANLNTAWQSLTQKLPKEEVTIEKTGKIRPLYRLLRVAAAVLLLATAGYWWSTTNQPSAEEMIQVANASKTPKEVELPDGSKVWLNENTSLAYYPSFTERHVELEGEAFFKVDRQEEHPFTIFSGEATTTVLGTSFNVRAYKEETSVEVTVEEGKVAFKQNIAEAKTAVILEKGNSGIFDKENKTVKVVEQKILNADAWKTKRLTFNNVKYAEVFQSFERYFEIDIDVENEGMLNCTLEMYDETDVTINEFIEYFEFTAKIKKTGPNTYQISGIECN